MSTLPQFLTREGQQQFESLGRFLESAEPGDRFTETQERAIKTHVFLARTDSDATGGRDMQGGIVETVTTRHYGRCDMWGEPEYQYRSATAIAPMHTSASGGCRSVMYKLSVGGKGRRVLLAKIENEKRYSAKKIGQIHEAAVELYDTIEAADLEAFGVDL